MDLEIGKIYMNNNDEFRKILNIYNGNIEYEKLEVIKCEDIDTFSNWATAGSVSQNQESKFDKIATQHFETTSYRNKLDEDINEWIHDICYDYNIIDIDIKYTATYSETGSYVKFSALVVLKLKYI